MRRREVLESMGALGWPGRGGFGLAQPQPDLGNIHETIEWISRQPARGLSFLDSRWKSVEEWKKVARPVYRRLLSYHPKPAPLSAKVLSREQRDGFTLESVRIAATQGYDIPGWLLIPAGAQAKRPGVIAIHCHGGCYVWGHEKILSAPGEAEWATQYRERAYGRPYTEFLARRGFVVLVTDGFYFGARRLKVEELDATVSPSYLQEPLKRIRSLDRGTTAWYRAIDRACSEFENLVAKTIFTAGATWPGILAWDDMRAVDYLMSRPEVDPKRIGCLGLSIGGMRTAHLIAADARIKAACVIGWMTAFNTQLRKHLRHHTWMIYVPGLYGQMDFPDAAGMMAPGALMVQQCSRDALYPMQGMKESVAKLEAVYRKAGVPERFRGVFYDVPHSFTPPMQEDAFVWLEKWL